MYYMNEHYFLCLVGDGFLGYAEILIVIILVAFIQFDGNTTGEKHAHFHD